MATQSQRISSHPFLRTMVPEHRSILLQGAEEQTLAAGEILFREGQPANRLYLIHEGQVALETHVPGKGEIAMASVGPGQVLGWSWLLPPFVWHFQARAIQPSRATILNGGHLLIASEQNHYLGYELMKNISKVILEVLLAAHERWLKTGHRPLIAAGKPSLSTVSDRTLPLDTQLAALPFFHGMQQGHLKEMAALARRKSYEPGQVLFLTGDLADGLFVIEQGSILLEATLQDERIPVQAMHAGEAVGWSSFCEPYEWQFSSRALDQVQLLFFSAAELREFCASDYHFGYDLTKRITRVMLQRLQGIRQRMWEAFR